MPLIEEIVARHDTHARWRRDIHAHPELGFEERRTAEFVAGKLEEFGVEVHRGIGNTGVVGVLRVGNETTSVGLRADMDALPIEEANTFAHRSTREGSMHACGHDGHTVMLLGAAEYLAATRNFRGQVVFIFQPAEEGIGGARAMVDDGLFRQFPCDRLFGMHNAPGMPVGRFGAMSGTVTAAGAYFDIDIVGVGGHGAFPHTAVDPVVIAAELALGLQSIVARNVRPTETAVVSVTQIHAGDAYNVIPATARLSGTARAFSMDVMELVADRMRALAAGVAKAHGGSAKVDFRPTYEPVVNDPAATRLAGEVCEELVGNGNVRRRLHTGTGSEDFSCMLNEVPGCYLLLGNGDSPPVHNPEYDFNDAAIPYGASFFASVAERALAVEREISRG